jgi:hypothetical protein
VNGILLRLESAEAPNGSKMAIGADVMVLASDHDPDMDRFAESSATMPNGDYLVPKSVVTQVWEVLEMASVQNSIYQVCIPSSGGDDRVVLGRGPTTSGYWRAFDTYTHQEDGQTYMCADAVAASSFALGSGDVPTLGSPRLLSPTNGDDEVNGGSPFQWSSVSGANTYELQLALDPAFSTLLMHEADITDTEAMPTVLARSATHYWRVRAKNGSNEVGPWSVPQSFQTSLTMVGLDDDEFALPINYSLHQNFPNPFNPSTTISFDLPIAGDVELHVVDILGRRVATLVDGVLAAGTHQIQYNASKLSSGVYIYQLVTNRTVLSRKMTLVK